MHRPVPAASITRLLALAVTLALISLAFFGCSPSARKTSEPTKERFSNRFVPGIFVETAALRRMLNDGDLALIDARPVESYQVAHLPGAVNLPKTTWREPRDLAYKRLHGFAVSPVKAGRVFGGAGIGKNTPVVVYDSVTFPDASVVWALLRYYGHKDVRVLKGGYEKWVGQGRPVTAEPPRVPARRFVPQPRPEMVATTEWLLKHKSQVVVLDMRSFEEYVGVNAAGNARGGSVPGAISIEWLELAGNSTIKPASEVERILRRHGVTKDKVPVTYCNWGIGRSTYGALVLEALGYRNVRIFGGSMEDWSARPNLPVADSQSLGSGL